MTETEKITEIIDLKIKKDEKVKKKGTPTWLSKWMAAIESGNFAGVNFRRKHPRLGSKISNLETRLRRVEKTLFNVKTLLSDDLKNSVLKKCLNGIEEDWEEILETL